jgi:hypothetical protein
VLLIKIKNVLFRMILAIQYEKGIYLSATVAIATVLLTVAMTPVWAQDTTDDTDDSSNFAEFIGCLFDGTEGTTGGEDTAQSVVEAIEGTAQSVPTEQDIRDCFEPIYEPAGTATGPATTLGPTIGATDGEDGEDGDETTGGESEGGEDEEG